MSNTPETCVKESAETTGKSLFRTVEEAAKTLEISSEELLLRGQNEELYSPFFLSNKDLPGEALWGFHKGHVDQLEAVELGTLCLDEARIRLNAQKRRWYAERCQARELLPARGLIASLGKPA